LIRVRGNRERNPKVWILRDFLRHQSVTTTEIYARIDNEQKREAIEKSSLSPAPKKIPSWQKNKGLLQWLENLGK